MQHIFAFLSWFSLESLTCPWLWLFFSGLLVFALVATRHLWESVLIALSIYATVALLWAIVLPVKFGSFS